MKSFQMKNNLQIDNRPISDWIRTYRAKRKVQVTFGDVITDLQQFTQAGTKMSRSDIEWVLTEAIKTVVDTAVKERETDSTTNE